MSDTSSCYKGDSVDDADFSGGDETPEESEPEANDAAESSRKLGKVRSKASQYYVGTGVAADCLALIIRCSMIENLNYTIFLKEYVAMGFQYIFCGRKSKATTLELSEEIISIAKSIFVKPNYIYDDRRAAMYLLYSLAISQPVESFAFVWVDSNTALVLGQFEIESRKHNDAEMLYCIGALYARGLARFTAADAEYGLGKPILHSRSEFLEKRRKAAIQTNNDFSQHEFVALQNISARMEAYDKCKKEAIDWSDPSDAKSLNFTSAGDLDRLLTIMKRLHTGDYDEPTPSSIQNDTVNHGETIRQKKMSAMVAPVNEAQHHVSKSEKMNKITNKISVKKIKHKKTNNGAQKLPQDSHLKTDILAEKHIDKEKEATQQTHLKIESQQENEVLIVIETMYEDDNLGEASATKNVSILPKELEKETSFAKDSRANSSDRKKYKSNKQRAAKKKK